MTQAKWGETAVGGFEPRWKSPRWTVGGLKPRSLQWTVGGPGPLDGQSDL